MGAEGLSDNLRRDISIKLGKMALINQSYLPINSGDAFTTEFKVVIYWLSSPMKLVQGQYGKNSWIR